MERIDDLSLGSVALPPTDGLRFALADGARAIVRPSGTEPKVKCYLEVVIPVDPEDGVDAARIAAAGRLDAIKGDIRAGRRLLIGASRSQNRIVTSRVDGRDGQSARSATTPARGVRPPASASCSSERSPTPATARACSMRLRISCST